MKAKNEKKAYSKPGVEVFELKNRCNLLDGSTSIQDGEDGGSFAQALPRVTNILNA